MSGASVPVRSPMDVDLMGDWMPSDLVLMVLEANVAVSVVGHDGYLAGRQECAIISPMPGWTLAATVTQHFPR